MKLHASIRGLSLITKNKGCYGYETVFVFVTPVKILKLQNRRLHYLQNHDSRTGSGGSNGHNCTDFLASKTPGKMFAAKLKTFAGRYRSVPQFSP